MGSRGCAVREREGPHGQQQPIEAAAPLAAEVVRPRELVRGRCCLLRLSE
jgi:hypothetical protein